MELVLALDHLVENIVINNNLDELFAMSRATVFFGDVIKSMFHKKKFNHLCQLDYSLKNVTLFELKMYEEYFLKEILINTIFGNLVFCIKKNEKQIKYFLENNICLTKDCNVLLDLTEEINCEWIRRIFKNVQLYIHITGKCERLDFYLPIKFLLFECPLGDDFILDNSVTKIGLDLRKKNAKNVFFKQMPYLAITNIGLINVSEVSTSDFINWLDELVINSSRNVSIITITVDDMRYAKIISELFQINYYMQMFHQYIKFECEKCRFRKYFNVDISKKKMRRIINVTIYDKFIYYQWNFSFLSIELYGLEIHDLSSSLLRQSDSYITVKSINKYDYSLSVRSLCDFMSRGC
ncbi:hypothetical protein SGHV120 [Glossina pallidipes salivary gland hypertrophy virus]|uniref:Uncharacterized protein n=1 Tax=Glossina hytrovirus (isolate Glossina pallidipes/Ethiopia/Seibersdorf/-) TaxID=379529 RepID=B0YLS4_GHVS|nr:hypothetical protein SGHV120 [Glossina pallidipes salivary gland hypertrophy virus]ABQ08893.1 hypothetical protein SGHV120 [Glossina pallidipes salivary gland hypertrophy virus]